MEQPQYSANSEASEAVTRPTHDMRHPQPERTIEQHIAYWDNERGIALNALVHATSMKIFYEERLEEAGGRSY